jgi:hypothetical protein
LPKKIRKLQGAVLEIERTGEFKSDDEENRWERCIFTIEFDGFSKRTPEEVIPEKLKGKKVKLVRYCCFDWHYKLGVKRTLDPDETKAVLMDKQVESVFW